MISPNQEKDNVNADTEVQKRSSHVTTLTQGECMTRSYCFQKVLEYFTHSESIKFQALNRYMYNVKMPGFIPEAIACRIEDCVLVYSDYRDKRGAISVVINNKKKSDKKCDNPSDEHNQLVEEFLERHKIFSRHFKYENRTWPCIENQKYFVALFVYK
jgi:hypothetical protein